MSFLAGLVSGFVAAWLVYAAKGPVAGLWGSLYSKVRAKVNSIFDNLK